MSISIPPGLRPVLEEFTIAVMRAKPVDIVEFAATYFTQLHSARAGQQGDAEMESSHSGEEVHMGKTLSLTVRAPSGFFLGVRRCRDGGWDSVLFGCCVDSGWCLFRRTVPNGHTAVPTRLSVHVQARSVMMGKTVYGSTLERLRHLLWLACADVYVCNAFC